MGSRGDELVDWNKNTACFDALAPQFVPLLATAPMCSTAYNV